MVEALMQYLQSPWVIAAFAVLLFVLCAVLLGAYMRKSSDMRHLKRVIRKHGYAVEQNVVLSDGIDGYLFVDYLILLRGKIIAMKVEPSSGYIFGGEKIDEWTRVENNRTGKFKNPMQEVGLFVQQVRHTLGFDAVEACVLFGSKSVFPKGVPQGVLQMAHFGEELDALKGGDDKHEAAQQAWEKLVAMTHEERQRLDLSLAS
ncbi:MAG: NERD domain-containing protein [Mariprofundaceae bacterium]|nr:NERD domain-containing protein [Mariprofundaceae bacterium]